MLRSPDDLLAADAPDDLRRLVAYWIARAAGRPMPGFADIDPVAIPWALSRVYVVRVVDGGADFVYRLAGEAINLRYPGTLAGRRITELMESRSAAAIVERWRRVIGGPAGCYVVSEHPTESGTRIRSRRVVLPLGPAGGPADHIIGMTVFEAFNLAGAAPISGMREVEVRWVELGDAG